MAWVQAALLQAPEKAVAGKRTAGAVAQPLRHWHQQQQQQSQQTPLLLLCCCLWQLRQQWDITAIQVAKGAAGGTGSSQTPVASDRTAWGPTCMALRIPEADHRVLACSWLKRQATWWDQVLGASLWAVTLVGHSLHIPLQSQPTPIRCQHKVSHPEQQETLPRPLPSCSTTGLFSRQSLAGTWSSVYSSGGTSTVGGHGACSCPQRRSRHRRSCECLYVDGCIQMICHQPAHSVERRTMATRLLWFPKTNKTIKSIKQLSLQETPNTSLAAKSCMRGA